MKGRGAEFKKLWFHNFLQIFLEILKENADSMDVYFRKINC